MESETMRRLRERFEAGDKTTLLVGMYNFLVTNRDAPQWIREGYVAAFNDVMAAKAGSWDDVFGLPHKKKGFHLEQKATRREKGPKIFIRAMELKMQGVPVSDDKMFQILAEEFNTSTGQAKRLYYQQRKAIYAAALPTAQEN